MCKQCQYKYIQFVNQLALGNCVDMHSHLLRMKDGHVLRAKDHCVEKGIRTRG